MCVSCVDTLEFDYNTNGKFSLFADEDFVQSFLPVENATDAPVENRVGVQVPLNRATAALSYGHIESLDRLRRTEFRIIRYSAGCRYFISPKKSIEIF